MSDINYIQYIDYTITITKYRSILLYDVELGKKS